MLYAEFNLDEVAEVRLQDGQRKFVSNLLDEGFDDARIARLVDIPLTRVVEYREQLQDEKKILLKKKNV
ncbi:hypothetical protein AGMMS49992_24260 [Clostridia bacterium]|nr:hypothetical protein AGMMS49992_24260 [Clostridia bacterium]